MASYVIVTLDTTPPTVEIKMPYSALPKAVIEVDIKASEPVDSQQSIYTIDSQGVRRDYTFYQAAPDLLQGFIDVQEYSLGISTICVSLTDLVGNKSSEISATWVIANYQGVVEGYMTVTEPHITVNVAEPLVTSHTEKPSIKVHCCCTAMIDSVVSEVL